MIDAGVPVAISTDCNPGSSPTTSMPLVMNLSVYFDASDTVGST